MVAYCGVLDDGFAMGEWERDGKVEAWLCRVIYSTPGLVLSVVLTK